jgi:hypothetical protein
MQGLPLDFFYYFLSLHSFFTKEFQNSNVSAHLSAIYYNHGIATTLSPLFYKQEIWSKRNEKFAHSAS